MATAENAEVVPHSHNLSGCEEALNIDSSKNSVSPPHTEAVMPHKNILPYCNPGIAILMCKMASHETEVTQSVAEFV